MPPIKAVLDSTVFVSALARGGIGAFKILLAAADHDFHAIVSPAIVEELQRVLMLQGMDLDEVATYLALLSTFVIVVTPVESITACRDPDDNMVLEVAVAGGADYIVTEDKDLRVLTPFRGIPIVTIRKFLRKFGMA